MAKFRSFRSALPWLPSFGITWQFGQEVVPIKKSDFVDLLNSVSVAKKSTDNDLMRRIKATGRLSQEEVFAFLRLYKATIDDIVQLISVDPELTRIVGLAYETD